MKLLIVLAALAVPLSGGLLATRLWSKKRERQAIALKLAMLLKQTEENDLPLTLLKQDASFAGHQSVQERLDSLPGAQALRVLLWRAGAEDRLAALLQWECFSLLLPVLVCFALGCNLAIALVVSVLLAVAPLFWLKSKAESRRNKFCEMLPDAIDLMVAVLRSGHSIPQAVKAVAHESPQPCGGEFESVLHRLNLGQPLAESLIISAKRFQSFELDLMRKAVTIHAEVGGSLAELLDKTNTTLRERLKQAKQLHVITAQSRLSAGIVGLLPIVLAIALNIMSPGYLQLLLDEPAGRLMLCASILLELLGVYVMKRMSTMRI